jgi:hypothetical protein
MERRSPCRQQHIPHWSRGGSREVPHAPANSPPEFAEVTNLMAKAMPSARVEWVEGGHLINPAHPAVLSFVDELLARG